MLNRVLNPYEPERLSGKGLTPPAIEAMNLGGWLGSLTLLLAALFLWWAFTAPIDEGVPVQGSVTTVGNRKIIQHPQGGVVSRINVVEGQRVRAGDVLLEINPLNSQANLEAAQLQVINLLASESRLRSERVDAPRIRWAQEFKLFGQDARVAEAKSVQSKLFESRADEYTTTLRTKRKQLALLKTDATNAAKLAAEGLLPRIEANNLAREALRSEAELSQLVNTRRSKIDAELSDILAQKEAVQAKVASLSFERDQFDVRAPVDGYVSGLRVNTLGGVITPAQTLMEIVPDDGALLVQAMVPTREIGKVFEGMDAHLRFVGFAEKNTPVVAGRVVLVGADKVAPDKVVDPHLLDMQRAEYYLVRLEITDDLNAKLPGKTLHPGMPVDVIFKGGERSFMSYLLKPLSDQLARSFLN